jgi:glycosyltransferase involved in cell wall biosynthesis
MNLKKVAIIGSVGIPAKYGGFETLTEQLTKNLNEKYQITVFCSAKSNDTSIKTYNNSKLIYLNLYANGIQSIPYDLISILKAIKFADTLLILGVGGCIILPLLKFFTKKKIIVNIDGLEWKRKKWGRFAKAYLKYSEKIAVKYADFVISDNKVIQEYVFNNYKKKSQHITYGGDHAENEKLSEDVQNQFPFIKEKYVLKVCRIESENNINIILEAFTNIKSYKLVIIGNWNYSEFGKNLKDKYSNIENIILLDPIYDLKILNQFRSNCHFYIHGHSAGGTNPSLVEAMYLGIPIIAFDVNYNRETTNNKAMYFKNSEDLIAKICNIKEIELENMKKDLKEYAHLNYTWEIITKKYCNLF